MIKIRKPLSFSEIGERTNQEDYLYPRVATTRTRVFVLCDGMGGHDKGEVASMKAAKALGEFLEQRGDTTLVAFEAGLWFAYDALDTIDSPSVKKPGTTLTCLCLNRDSYLVAHIGDSRIYHIRPSMYNPATGCGGIIYQSSDHSLVNDLLRAGELTAEEAKTFPQRNVITRAMLPKLDRRHKADVYIFDDVKGGDFFFLCSDGVLECLTNDVLCQILADVDTTDAEKMMKIKDVCYGKTCDNYSCWLVPVDKVEIDTKFKPGRPMPTAVLHAEDSDSQVADSAENSEEGETPRKKSWFRRIFG